MVVVAVVAERKWWCAGDWSWWKWRFGGVVEDGGDGYCLRKGCTGGCTSPMSPSPVPIAHLCGRGWPKLTMFTLPFPMLLAGLGRDRKQQLAL